MQSSGRQETSKLLRLFSAKYCGVSTTSTKLVDRIQPAVACAHHRILLWRPSSVACVIQSRQFERTPDTTMRTISRIRRFRPASIANYDYAFGSSIYISQWRLRNYFAIADCDHRRRRDHGDSHDSRIVAGGGDNVVLDSAIDRLITWLTNFICSDLSSFVQ